jgi:hypothetical protein
METGKESNTYKFEQYHNRKTWQLKRKKIWKPNYKQKNSIKCCLVSRANKEILDIAKHKTKKDLTTAIKNKNMLPSIRMEIVTLVPIK